MAEVVMPALSTFAPDLLIVAADNDGGFTDPAGRMALCSRDFHRMGSALREWADRPDCRGVVLTHEGGYARSYVPLLAAGLLNGVSGREIPTDPFVRHWGEGFAPPVGVEVDEIIERGRGILAML